MLQKIIIFTLLCILGFPCVAGAVEVAPQILDREVIESLIELKEQQKALSQRLADMERMDEWGPVLTQKSSIKN